MGGCASSPKDLNLGSEPVPVEAPVSSNKAEAEAEAKAETAPQENNVDEKKEEEPLIDISEPAKEESPKADEESKTTVAEIVPELIKPSEKEEVKPADSTEVTAPTAEIAEALQEPAEVKPEVEVVTPRSVDKSDAPLVTV